MARFGDGLATDADLIVAARRATEESVRVLDGRQPDLCAVFACGVSAEQIGEALAVVADSCGAPVAIGGSMPGVIAAGRGVEASSAVAVWSAVLPEVRIRGFALEVLPADAGMAVVGLPEHRDDDAAIVLLADPWSFPIDGFVEQSNAALPGVPIVGGMAAGPTGRGSTRLLVDGRVVDRGAVGVVLGGPVGARAVVSQGCRPVGPTMTVTASESNVIQELAGVPALTKLEEIVTALPPVDQALVTRGLQIGIARDEYADEHGQGDFLVRGIAGSAAGGGLVVGDLVPVGRTVRFQARDAAAAHDDLVATLERFRASGAIDTVEGALLFSCNGRGAAMFPTADHDPDVLRSSLSTNAGIAGCFAAGEIGPVAGRNYVHGFTASILAFGSGAVAQRGTSAASP